RTVRHGGRAGTSRTLMECGIGIGSNAGRRTEHLCAAVEELRALGLRPEVSPVYETDPVDCPPDSRAFLNAVAIVDWEGSPVELLAELPRIEASRGRHADRARNAP